MAIRRKVPRARLLERRSTLAPRARPTTPNSVTGATSSGNNETTPKRYIARPQWSGDQSTTISPAARSTCFTTCPTTKGIKRSAVPRTTSTSFAPVASRWSTRPSESAGCRSNLEPFEIRPVELARSSLRQPLALDRDFGAQQFASPIRIVNTAQLGDHVAAVALTVLYLEQALGTVQPQSPDGETSNVVAGLRVGLHFEPPLHAEHAADAAEGDPLLECRAHCGTAGRTDRLRRAAQPLDTA